MSHHRQRIGRPGMVLTRMPGYDGRGHGDSLRSQQPPTVAKNFPNNPALAQKRAGNEAAAIITKNGASDGSSPIHHHKHPSGAAEQSSSVNNTPVNQQSSQNKDVDNNTRNYSRCENNRFSFSNVMT